MQNPFLKNRSVPLAHFFAGDDSPLPTKYPKIYPSNLYPMIVRYLILFGGILIMITGCNSLVSQHFGTHALRIIPAAGATAEGIGDADFVKIRGVAPGQPQLTVPADDGRNSRYVFRPLLTPAQQTRWENGSGLSTNLIGWFKTTGTSCGGGKACLPHTGAEVLGLISKPAAKYNPSGKWAEHGVTLTGPVVYLQLGQKPLAWYWNLLLFVGGALLAFLPEAIRSRRTAGIK